VTPFALESGSQFRPLAPPALRTGNYAREFEEARVLGAIDSLERTVDQTEIALFWGYGPGTATPPGHWNQVAHAVAADQGNSLAENARLFALLNIALADAAIVSWDSKYVYNYWRPITAIRLADSDGNAKTAPYPVWSPLLETPPFPEYTSGHSTFSGAAAVTLALFYGRDRIPFSVGSDDLPGVYRFYGGFWEAAAESGMSRIYGGIHFMSANRHGLLTGARTGRYVFHNFLSPKRNYKPD
jgi:membrane-associated phospholipid phosphatase